LSIPSRSNYSIAQAHHLICSEVLNTEDWAEACAAFGYDINCVENGIFLPADLRVACQLKIPLHRGNHSQTESDETPDYVSEVTDLVMPVLEAAQEGEYCTKKRDIIKKMNSLSKRIWGNVKSFSWILTYDGLDYDSGAPGCLGALSLPGKRKIEEKGEVKKCKKKRRDHGITLTKSIILKEQ